MCTLLYCPGKEAENVLKSADVTEDKCKVGYICIIITLLTYSVQSGICKTPMDRAHDI